MDTYSYKGFSFHKIDIPEDFKVTENWVLDHFDIEYNRTVRSGESNTICADIKHTICNNMTSTLNVEERRVTRKYVDEELGDRELPFDVFKERLIAAADDIKSQCETLVKSDMETRYPESYGSKLVVTCSEYNNGEYEPEIEFTAYYRFKTKDSREKTIKRMVSSLSNKYDKFVLSKDKKANADKEEMELYLKLHKKHGPK